MARSTLVDQWGRPIYYGSGGARKHARGAERDTSKRPYEPIDLRNIDEAISTLDHAFLISGSRALFANHGVVKAACVQKGRLSVGDHWRPSYIGGDVAWGAQATNWLRAWMKSPDVRGSVFDWQTLLYLNSVALDRDGDVLVVKIIEPDGKPRLQHIPAHKIGQREPEGFQITSGTYEGARMWKGVLVDDANVTLAWNIPGDPSRGVPDEIIDASEGWLIYDPDYHEQIRGLPAGTAALNMMRDSLTSHEWEQMALLILSDLALIESNAHGGPEAAEAAILGDAAGEGIRETRMGGTTRVISSDGDIRQITHDRPGDVWDRFADRNIRTWLAAMDWPYSMAWKHEGNSVVEHAEIQKAQTAVEDRQSALRKFAVEIVEWAIDAAIDAGELPDNDERGAWKFSVPPRVSLNLAKDGREYRAQLLEGHLTETTFQGWSGREVDDHYRERAREIALQKRIAREVSEETGEEVTLHDMAMRGPNDLPNREEESNDE
jgi:hypothetical protein